MSLTTKQQSLIGAEVREWDGLVSGHPFLPETELETTVTEQELKVLVRTPSEKAVIGKLGKELKALNPNNPILVTARKDWVNPKGGFFHIKQLLTHAIQIEKSTKLVFSALAKINA